MESYNSRSLEYRKNVLIKICNSHILVFISLGLKPHGLLQGTPKTTLATDEKSTSPLASILQISGPSPVPAGGYNTISDPMT
jgi:hypothetical protein